MLTLIVCGALAVALIGAWALGYSPKALWLAAKAKYQAWKRSHK